MHEIFINKIFPLPPDTLLFFGHEYAEDNLKFANFIDPENQVYLEELKEAERRSEQK